MAGPQGKQSFTIDRKDPPPLPPPTLIIRRNTDGRAPLVLPEDEALELYLALHEHFHGGDPDAAQEAEPG